MIDALLGAGCQTIERIAVVEAVFVDLVQCVELGVVGLFQMGRNEQKGISLTIQHILGDVFTFISELHKELGIGRVLTLHHALPTLTQVGSHVVGTEVELR